MKQGVVFVAIATLLFSVMEVSLKISGVSFNPNQLNFLRFLIGGLVLLPFALKKLKAANYKMTKKDYIQTAITGFVCVVISMTCFLLSVTKLSASLAAILISCNTFFGILFGQIFLKEKNSKLVGIALLVCFTGMFFTIINPFNIASSNIRMSVAGIILGLLCAVTFALYGVVGKIFAKGKPIGGLVMTSFAFIFGATELGLLMGLTHIPTISNMLGSAGLTNFVNIPFFTGISLSTLPILLFISICITGIAFACYFYAIEKISITFASLVFFIKPMLAPIFAMIILGETQQFHFWIGVVLITIGSLVIFNENRKKMKIKVA